MAAITLTQAQQFMATVPGGGGVTWSVDGVAGGSTASGTVDPTGLYTTTTSTTPGTHTITATSVANTGQASGAVAAVTDLAGVSTFHNDNARDGANTQEYALTAANVQPNSFGKISACTVDGAIYGQPLWVPNLQINGARHNVVFVATAHDSLYAYDADSTACSLLWSVSLIDTNHDGTGGETSVPGGTSGNLVGAGYGDISPEVGVIGTPVIDLSNGTLYVVSKSVDATQSNFYQRLHAIDITSGNEKTGSPVVIAGTYPQTGGGNVTFSAHDENQRAGLTLLNGIVYVAWGSHEDANTWYGWMMGYSYNGTAFSQTSVLNVSPNTGEAGIWLSGGAPAVDSANNLYISTGNGNFDATPGNSPGNDYGDSLMQLTAGTTLSVSQTFTPGGLLDTPGSQLNDAANDVDFGAGGVTVLPDLPSTSTVPHLIVAGDKSGNIYLINRDILGGYQNILPVQTIPHPGQKNYATGAFWNNTYYIAGSFGPLSSYALNTSSSTFTTGPTSAHGYGFPGSSPSVSASGATQNGIVWSLDNTNYCTNQSGGCGAAVLYAYDATNVNKLLWSSPTGGAGAAGYAVKFTVPTVANGKVYVGTRGNNTGGSDNTTSTPGELDIFGLTP
jgi:hypothetical protein